MSPHDRRLADEVASIISLWRLQGIGADDALELQCGEVSELSATAPRSGLICCDLPGVATDRFAHRRDPRLSSVTASRSRRAHRPRRRSLHPIASSPTRQSAPPAPSTTPPDRLDPDTAVRTARVVDHSTRSPRPRHGSPHRPRRRSLDPIATAPKRQAVQPTPSIARPDRHNPDTSGHAVDRSIRSPRPRDNKTPSVYPATSLP